MNVTGATMIMMIMVGGISMPVRCAGVPSSTTMLGMIIMIGMPMVVIMITSPAPFFCVRHAARPPLL